MKYIKLLIWILFAAGMVSCHSIFTAPVLFNHGSSSAFNMAVGIYVFILIIVVYTWLYFWDSK